MYTGLVIVSVLSFIVSWVSSAYIRPVRFPNGSIGTEVIQTDDVIRTPESTAGREEGSIDVEAFEFPLTPNDVSWLSSLLRLPEEGKTRIRKEYRIMTDEERRDFHLALNILKNDTSVSLNKYDLLANIHSRSSVNKAAHAGPGFLGWHRVFLLMTENALRQAVSDVTIPYWDVTLDSKMDRPYESIIWSSYFLGSGQGSVSDGPFALWETPFGFGHLKRLITAQGRLMTEADIERILSKKRLGDISYFNAQINTNIEALHNRVHVWVGGQMRKIEIGAFDPTFFLLHSFIDKVWEDFRDLQRKEGVDPEKDYPWFYGRSGHSPLAPMGLGSLVVLDGLNNIWGQRVRYWSRPTCEVTADVPLCGSPYLKCDLNNISCVSITMRDAQISTFEFKNIDQGNARKASESKRYGKHGAISDVTSPFKENEANSTKYKVSDSSQTIGNPPEETDVGSFGKKKAKSGTRKENKHLELSNKVMDIGSKVDNSLLNRSITDEPINVTETNFPVAKGSKSVTLMEENSSLAHFLLGANGFPSNRSSFINHSSAVESIHHDINLSAVSPNLRTTEKGVETLVTNGTAPNANVLRSKVYMYHTNVYNLYSDERIINSLFPND